MINKWLNKIDCLHQKDLILWIVASSILLAAWMQYIQHGWINPDSVLYFEQARLFALGDWQGMLKVYQWPLYGTCIGVIYKLTPLDIQASAQLLNMLFFGIATTSFLQLIKLAGGGNRTIVAGALLLFSNQYIVGDALEMLMRDGGFWAFYLSSLVFFTRFVQCQKPQDALLWKGCIIIATLFRIEAILFLLFLPLILLSFQKTSLKLKFQGLIKTYSISIIIAIAIAIVLFTHPQLSMSQFGRLDEVFTSNLYHVFTQKIIAQAEIMSNQVLGEYLDEYAISGLLVTFLYVITSKIITTTGLIGTGLAIFGYKYSSNTMQATTRLVLLVAAGIAFTSLFLIIIKVFILSSRYVVGLAWILLIFASFYLATLSSKDSKKLRIIFITLCLVLGLSFIKNILPKRDGYNYAQEAVAWLKQENVGKLPVFYNESRIRYYANESFTGAPGNIEYMLSAIENQSIYQYDYLMIASSRSETERLESAVQKIPQYKQIRQFFDANHKKSVLILKKE